MQTIAHHETTSQQLLANTAYIEIVCALGDRQGFRISRRAIARAAGVGIWTVTRVISNFPSVAPETRLAVLRAIAALSGRPIETLVLGRVAA